MRSIAKIALCEPDSEAPGQYFSARLKSGLQDERVEYAGPSRIFAVSNIEGNFRSFRNLLIRNGVINEKYQWIFEDGHLIIAGDCFGRNESVIECLWFVYALEDKAIRKGGYVHFILGNHEIKHLNGSWRNLSPRYADIASSKSRSTYAILYDGNNEIWRWLQTKNVVEKLGDILFVHGGISPEVIQMNLSINEINRVARPYYTKRKNPFADERVKIILNSAASPFWFRGYYRNVVNEAVVDATLNRFNVGTIVTGHTPVRHVSSFFNNKVINIDTGHKPGHSEALLIEGDAFYRVTRHAERERIK